MKIQYLNGGLGNQIFQYIFKRYVEIATGEKVWLDDMKFFKADEHNGYELTEIFHVETDSLLSHYFDPDIWEYMVQSCPFAGSNVCQQLKDSGENIVMVAETDNYQFDGTVVKIPANCYLPSIERSVGNIYYWGYWINKEWMEAIRPAIMEELRFPDITDNENITIANHINSEDCISVHVRRGDFVDLGWQLPMDFYQNAMRQLYLRLPHAGCYVFSDDVDWCKQHYKELGLDMAGDNLYFVTHNSGKAAFRDMQLMSMCKGMVIANSAFSYYAALCNQRPDKIVYNPLPYRQI